MDPTTTLFTFLFQTDPSVQSVQLIGSWDNFSTCYTMKRDTRRGNDQWRGCYSFQNMVREDSAYPDQKRVGGLKMGHTYFYYYEVDGSTETFDPSMPYTTACPYLPGQMVNTLNVPMERTLRNRSASTGSIRQEDFKTMDPDAKFTTPKPLPTLPLEDRNRRTASPLVSQQDPTPCSPSPPSSWKRLFDRKMRGRGTANGRQPRSERPKRHLFRSVDHAILTPARENSITWTFPSIVASTESPRTRDISPESLHRFLREDTSLPSKPNTTERPLLTIPDVSNAMEADETDDDDDFAASAVSESQSYFTRLSPPPFQRSTSDESVARTIIVPPEQAPAKSSKEHLSSQSRWSISVASGTVSAPISDEEPVALYDYNDEEDTEDNDEDSALPDFYSTGSPCRKEVFTGYSLPRLPEESKILASPGQSLSNFDSGDLISGAAAEIPVSGSNLLGDHTDSGLDNFANELGWIMDVISNLNDS